MILHTKCILITLFSTSLAIPWCKDNGASNNGQVQPQESNCEADIVTVSKRGPMSRELYEMICKVLRGADSESVSRFAKENKDYLFYKGNSKKPIFYLDTNMDGEISLYRKYRGEPKEVVNVDKAKDIITRMHRLKEGGPCNPKGINALTRQFCQRYYIHGAQELVTQIKNQCTGPCKATKTLNVLEPPPKAIHTSKVMERVQIDLMHLYGEKSPFKAAATHQYKYILSIMDCFSKYCWLVPLSNKTANCVSRGLFAVFKEFGCPKYLQSDNGGEFVNSVISSLCETLHITIKHGRPYHPQSQGQVESLNKRVKGVLVSQLLQYQPCDQVNVWPYLLPHVAHYLNNTWHLTIQDTPFKVFYGRASGNLGQNSAAHTCGILPDDSTFMCMTPFISSDGSQGLQIDSSNNDLQPCAVDELTEENMHVSCHTSIDHVIAPSQTEEDVRNLSTLDRIRSDIETSVLESTERKNVRHNLLYLKQASLNKFCTGQEVFFKKSIQIGLVSVSCIRGRVEKALPGDFYEVSYTLNEHEHRCTLSAAQMASTTCAGLSSELYNDQGDVVTTEVILQQLQQTANAMRQRFCRRKVEKGNPELCENVHSILKDIGFPEMDSTDPNHLTDLLAYALDLAVISSIQESTLDFHQQCSTYSEALLSFLLCQNFSFFASGIYLWEHSRFQNVHPLLASLEDQQLPVLVGAQHKCWECVLSQHPCSHPCCKVWYVDCGLKCGYLTTNDCVIGTVNTNGDSDEDQANHSESQDNGCVTSQEQDTQNISLSSGLQSTKSSTTTLPQDLPGSSQNIPLTPISATHPDPNNSSKILRSRRKLRPVCSQGTYEALISRPSVMSKARLQALLNTLNKQTSLCSQAFLNFNSKCGEVMELWDQLPKEDKASLSKNIQYAVSILGKHASTSSLLNIRVVSRNPFMQVQGSSAWCGLCALNNAAGSELFTPMYLDEVSDNVWLSLFEDIGSTLFDYYEPLRSIDGDYNIEVLMQAAALMGYTLTYMNNAVYDFLQTCDTCDKQNWPEFSQLSGSNKVMILRHTTSHYSTIILRGGRIWHLDSKKSKPSELSNSQLISLLGPLRQRATRASLFSFTKNELPLACTETMPSSPAEESLSEDDSLPIIGWFVVFVSLKHSCTYVN